MTSNKNKKPTQFLVEYELTETDSGLLDNAFDILFEETLKEYDILTTNDN